MTAFRKPTSSRSRLRRCAYKASAGVSNRRLTPSPWRVRDEKALCCPRACHPRSPSCCGGRTEISVQIENERKGPMPCSRLGTWQIVRRAGPAPPKESHRRGRVASRVSTRQPRRRSGVSALRCEAFFRVRRRPSRGSVVRAPPVHWLPPDPLTTHPCPLLPALCRPSSSTSDWRPSPAPHLPSAVSGRARPSESGA